MTRILGIDPGSRATGFGVIEMDGQRAVYVTGGCIRPDVSDSLGERLQIIYRGIDRTIDRYRPDEVAVEMVFMNRNPDSALKLGQARGAAMVCAANRGLPLYEFTPAQIKQAIVGKGNADKVQVQHMVRVLLCLREQPAPDVADALATALCHGHTRQGLLKMGDITGLRAGRYK
jgi:crossover junction endodeoxyribonuclease RuvC